MFFTIRFDLVMQSIDCDGFRCKSRVHKFDNRTMYIVDVTAGEPLVITSSKRESLGNDWYKRDVSIFDEVFTFRYENYLWLLFNRLSPCNYRIFTYTTNGTSELGTLRVYNGFATFNEKPIGISNALRQYAKLKMLRGS